ncbi:hypothetical protein KC19_1G161100 [Ceratodon purpureus]|uniref:Uncharacterized protein n=1 Tax=Ceratodon purpureus TaxID=3225 RepID=A0A8T0J6J8_CERPU|nr:hypothetical protein KC19_1G161100 [Ceratodon purpureus]
MKTMKGGIEVLPPVILQDILTMGRLESLDLANLDMTSSVFRAPSGSIGGFKSITEAAAHSYCEKHQLFESLDSSARLQLLARCEGNWKLVLHFLECLERSSGRVTEANAGKKVLTAGGKLHTLIVNKQGELFACGKGGAVLGQGQASTTTLETPRLIFLPAAASRIVQISASFEHAAFVTETGQVYTFGDNTSGCCGIGMRAAELRAVLKPTHVRTLRNIPCQQVTTGKSFTMAITRLGEVYSWGCNTYGQLGHRNTRDKSRPRQIDQFDESDPVVQVSAGECHSLAVTKSGKLFSWGHDYNHFAFGHDVTPIVLNKLFPKRVEHGGFHGLFFVSAVAGDNHSVAIDHCGRVYKWGNEDYFSADSRRIIRRERRREAEQNKQIPVLVQSLKFNRAVQVVARGSTFVLLDSGTVCCVSGVNPLELWQGSTYATVGDKAHSITCGHEHAVIVTKKGTTLGIGYNESKQLGVVWDDWSKRSIVVLDPVEVFTQVHLPKTERMGCISPPYSSCKRSMQLLATALMGLT